MMELKRPSGNNIQLLISQNTTQNYLLEGDPGGGLHGIGPLAKAGGLCGKRPK